MSRFTPPYMIVCANCGAGPDELGHHCEDHDSCDLVRCAVCRSIGNRTHWSEDPRIKSAGRTPEGRASQPRFDPDKVYDL